MIIWSDLITIISNLAFLFPAAEAIERQYWGPAILYVQIVICSSAYHSCNAGLYCFGLSPNTLRDMDFYTAQLTIPIIALYLIRVWSDAWYALKVVIFAAVGFGLFLAQRYWSNSAYVQLAVTAGSFGGILFYWLLYALKAHNDGASSMLPPYRWDMVALGLGISGVAVALFGAEMLNHSTYSYVHALWHVDAALGQFFLLCAWPNPSEPIRLFDNDAKNNRGHRVPLLYPHPHPYAIPTSGGGGGADGMSVVHRTPQSRVITIVNSV